MNLFPNIGRRDSQIRIPLQGQGRAAGYPPSIRGFPVPVKDEYMAIIVSMIYLI